MKADTRYENSDGIFTIEMTPSQMRFLRDLFGEQASWTMITQTVFNRSINALMIEQLANSHFVGPTPARARNPLMIPEDQLPGDCPAAVKLRLDKKDRDGECANDPPQLGDAG